MTNEMVYYYLEVTIDGGKGIYGNKQKFTYYKDPTILDISPNSGPTRGGTTVAVKGKGFN